MSQSRRDDLRAIATPPDDANAGLWLDKFMPFQVKKGDPVPAEGEPRQMLVESTASIPEPPAYKTFFETQWEPALAQAGAATKKAEVIGRLVVGLGSEAVLENSITLHRTYGAPYIPGSALKGLAAWYARNRLEGWDKDGEDYRILFGDTESAGFVTFFDALYVPGSGHKKQALWPDVITVHHPDYYQGKDAPPADWDSPTPIPFLSATGKYLIALSGPEEWVEAAFQILALALDEVGIGAKTSSGYGRMKLEMPKPKRNIVKEFLERWQAEDASALPQNTNKYYEEWKGLTDVDDAGKTEIAQAILDRLSKDAAKFVKRKRGKAWYKDLEDFVSSHKQA